MLDHSLISLFSFQISCCSHLHLIFMGKQGRRERDGTIVAGKRVAQEKIHFWAGESETGSNYGTLWTTIRSLSSFLFFFYLSIPSLFLLSFFSHSFVNDDRLANNFGKE